MGGLGSGNFSWKRCRRALVEHALILDLAALTRAGSIKAGAVITGQWNAAAPLGGDYLTVRYDGDLTDLETASIVFSFWLGGIEYRQRIKVVTTQPHLSGTRLWFVCPLRGDRVRVLYLPAGSKHFASRKAHRLSYRSQGESTLFRSITRAQNIRARLGGDLSIHAPFPPRPKGMHRHTYERLREEAMKIEGAALEALLVKEDALNRRISTSLLLC